MSTAQVNIGYKAFNPTETGYKTRYGDHEARYHLGEIYAMDCDEESLELCKNGFHYCPKVNDVLDYYSSYAVITKIEILGYVKSRDNKCCTNKYKIIELYNGTFHRYGCEFNYKDGLFYVPPTVPYFENAKCWHKDGKLHRDGDQPALISADGTKHWYQNGKLHRDGDQPAIIYSNGTQYWYKDGLQHRDGNLPAVIYSNGKTRKYQYGVRIKH